MHVARDKSSVSSRSVARIKKYQQHFQDSTVTEKVGDSLQCQDIEKLNNEKSGTLTLAAQNGSSSTVHAHFRELGFDALILSPNDGLS